MGMKSRKAREITILDIYANYSEETVREASGDGWDRGDTECSLNYVSATLRKYTVTSNWPEEKLPERGDVIYVVVEITDEADTFGCTSNVPHARTWFATSEEAARYVESEPTSGGFFGGHKEWRIEPTVVS